MIGQMWLPKGRIMTKHSLASELNIYIEVLGREILPFGLNVNTDDSQETGGLVAHSLILQL